MKFYSTSDRKLRADFETAVRDGLAPDGGLYMPAEWSPLPGKFWSDFYSKNFGQLSFEVASHVSQDSIQSRELRGIIDEAITFDAPLVRLDENVFALELFHGPTFAFKDFGARFLAATLSRFSGKSMATVLVATSGDTGSAVAAGFHNVPNTRVVVLYPSGKVSKIQEAQFATLGGNVTAVEVSGTFDDCQRLVKEAFKDTGLRSSCGLTSANSINIARLLPQMFYYFRAVQQLPAELRGMPVVFSVPSGNFGNLTAGVMSMRLGLEIKRFVAATNANDVVPEFLRTGDFVPRPSVPTLSNAMDVGNPSNFARLLELFDHQIDLMRSVIKGFSFSDRETIETIKRIYNEQGYMLDPHGAVAYMGLNRYMEEFPSHVGVFLETAHPAKFAEGIEASLKTKVEIPDRLSRLLARPRVSIKMKPEFSELRDFLLGLH